VTVPRATGPALVLFVSLACLLLVPPADSAWPGRDGAIAFSRGVSGSVQSKADIWIETRSGKQRRLTASPRVDETEPSFSPNGRLVAFVRRVGGDADVWVMRSDGSRKRAVVGSGFDELDPAFLPSGEGLVFTRFDGEGDRTIYSVMLDGSEIKRRVADASEPAVSSSGRWLAYSEHGRGGGIGLRNLRTGKTRHLTTGRTQGLDFTPDGTRLVFTAKRRCRPGGPLRFAILKLKLRNPRARILRLHCDREYLSPAWSPSGRRIVFTYKRRRTLSLRLGVINPFGRLTRGTPRHRAGTDQTSPSWQPLPRPES
jgi:Tol biopolymer transport system component